MDCKMSNTAEGLAEGVNESAKKEFHRREYDVIETTLVYVWSFMVLLDMRRTPCWKKLRLVGGKLPSIRSCDTR